MKYFAKLDSNNIVLEVHVIQDKNASNEEKGIEFLKNWNNHPYWVQCSKDGSIRKNGAAKGMTYDKDKDAFIPIQPFPSWTLHETRCAWDPPVPVPDDCAANHGGVGKYYRWDEETTSWKERT